MREIGASRSRSRRGRRDPRERVAPHRLRPGPGPGISPSTRRSSSRFARVRARRPCACTAGRRRRSRSATAQDRDRDVDRDACRRAASSVIRRITGGRAVLHDAEVTYSVSVPAGLAGFGTGLDEAYRRVAAGLVAGLRLLGLRAAVPAPGFTRSVAATPSRCLFRDGRPPRDRGRRPQAGRQRAASRRRGVSPARVDPPREPPRTAGPGAARSLSRASAARMTGLAEVLPHCPAPEAVVAAIVDGCAAAWGASLRPGKISAAEVRAARALEASRYRDEDWNAGRHTGAAR